MAEQKDPISFKELAEIVKRKVDAAGARGVEGFISYAIGGPAPDQQIYVTRRADFDPHFAVDTDCVYKNEGEAREQALWDCFARVAQAMKPYEVTPNIIDSQRVLVSLPMQRHTLEPKCPRPEGYFPPVRKHSMRDARREADERAFKGD